MKKILFVMYNLGYGGAERSLVNLLQELTDEAYEIDLLLFQRRGDFIQQLPENVHVLDTPEDIRGLYAPLKKSGRFWLAKLVGTGCARIMRNTKKSQSAFRWRKFYSPKIGIMPKHYDVAVAYVGSEILYFVQDKVVAEKKLVWIHNDYCTAGYSKIDDYPYFEKMDGIVSVSKECVDVLRREFPEYCDKIYEIENITSSAVVRKMAETYYPEEYEGNKYNILSVGRLWPQKGFDMAVQAAAILKKQGINFRWIIIGEGYLRECLQKQIQKEELEDYFILGGNRKNPYPYMKYCTLLVQPSLYEGKSVVLDEAKILCVPIVATNYPTVRDQIIPEKEGLIIEMSPDGIAEGIMTLLGDEKRRNSLSDYLKTREYGNQEEVKKYKELLE